jgi:hypothetical protein
MKDLAIFTAILVLFEIILRGNSILGGGRPIIMASDEFGPTMMIQDRIPVPIAVSVTFNEYRLT